MSDEKRWQKIKELENRIKERNKSASTAAKANKNGNDDEIPLKPNITEKEGETFQKFFIKYFKAWASKNKKIIAGAIISLLMGFFIIAGYINFNNNKKYHASLALAKYLNLSSPSENLNGMTEYRNSMDKLFGGSHPEAGVRVSPEMERMGYRVGMDLVDRKSTKYDVEEARLLDQMRTASGRQRVDLTQQIFDLPIKKKRELMAIEQARENELLRRNLNPYVSAVTDLQKVLALPNLDTDTSKQIKQLQDAIVGSLKTATNVIYVGDQPYYKGITDRSLLKRSSKLIQSALEQSSR